MNRLHQLLYLQEIQAQCRMANIAFDSLSAWPAPYPESRTNEQGAVKTAALFRELHSMLTHAGVISRLLWPASSGKGAMDRNRRAEALRDLLGLSPSSHLLCDRALRDGLEHFDERLDSWTARTEAPPDYWQDCIGPWGVMQTHGAKDHNVMRHYDPSTQHFRFQGKPIHMPTLGQAVKALQLRVDGEVAQLLAQLYQTPGHIASPDYPSVMPS